MGSKFNIGDTVCIVKYTGYITEMHLLKYTIATVEDFVKGPDDNYWYELDNNTWQWREDWLELVARYRNGMEDML